MKSQLVVIDSRVRDHQFVIDQIAAGYRVLELDARKDGLAQIADYLSGHNQANAGEVFSAIHLISHGTEGEIQLGSLTLDSAHLAREAKTLSQIHSLLAPGADLLLYGCDVAQGVRGSAFVTQLAKVSGLDVAASTNLTGGKTGDWVLETTAGQLQAQVLELNLQDSLLAGILITGTAGNDSLTSTAGDDTINGLDGDDTIKAGTGAFGNDKVDGGAGADWIYFANLPSTSVTVNLANHTATSTLGSVSLTRIEKVAGTNLADSITGGDLPDKTDALGNRVTEWLRGNGGNDTLTGGAGADFSTASDYSNNTSAQAVTANLRTGVAQDGLGGTDTLVNIDFLVGGAGNDALTGGSLSRDPFGTFYETFRGNAGNDTLDGSNNSNDGDYASSDRADYSRNTTTQAVSVNLSTGLASDGLGGTDTLISIDQIYGGAGNDTFGGGNARETFDGGAGNDSIDGGAGSDQVRFQQSTAAVVVNLSAASILVGGKTIAASTADDGMGGTDTLSNIENVRGSDFNDYIRGSDDSTVREYLAGDAGNDTIDGGMGVDIAQYGDTPTSQGGITASLVAGADGVVRVTDKKGGVDTLINIEGLSGTHAADSLTGSSGNDYLRGQGGSDTLDGGTGSDWVIYTADPTSVTVNLQTGQATDGWNGASGVLALGGTDTLRNIENAEGSDFNDTIIGSAVANQLVGRSGSDALFGGDGNDSLLGGEGRDTLDGGLGDDTLDGGTITDTLNLDDLNIATYSSANAAVAVSLEAGTSSGAAGNDVLRNINMVIGTGSGDTLTGSNRTEFAEFFEGGAGNDTIDGLGGNFDVAMYSSATAAVTVNLANGTATGTSTGTDTLRNVEAVFGSNFADLITGGANSSMPSELFRGNGGNDTIDGGSGNDWSFYDTGTAGVVVTLGGSIDGSASDGLGGTDVLRSIEGVRGSAFNDTLTGSNRTDSAETFEGREGNDVIDGKGGLDTAWYKNSRSGVSVDLSQGKAINDGYGTSDTLINIENVYGSRDFNDLIKGDAGDNRLEGNGGNDTLSGNAGEDSLIGGAGDDLIDGGSNTAPYAYDWVIYDAASGAVQVNLSMGKSAGADGVDTLTGIEAISGSSFADTLTGDANTNILLGNGGNDTIDGGDGYDIANYSRASGSVTVSLLTNTSTGADGTDTLIRIEGIQGGQSNDLLTGDANNNWIGGNGGDDSMVGGTGTDTANYHRATGGVTVNLATGRATGADGNDTLDGFENIAGSMVYADSLTGNDGNNWIEGNGGNDTLIGGAGNDSLLGGDGRDTLDGGAGNDTLDGGTNRNMVRYSGATAGVVVNLVTGTASDGQGGTDTLININQVGGSAFNDQITIGAGGFAEGGAGNDLLIADFISDSSSMGGAFNGGAGNDTIVGSVNGTDLVSYSMAARIDGATVSGSGTSWTIGRSGSNLLGLSYNATTTKWTATDLRTNTTAADPNLGTDSLQNIGIVHLNGVDGVGANTALDFKLSVRNGVASVSSISLIANGEDVDANDSLIGTSGADLMIGGGGNDTLAALDGNDTLLGHDGDDQLAGGAGNDTLLGGNGQDFIEGGLDDDYLDGGSNDITLGYDWVSYQNATGAVTVNLATGLASGADGNDTLNSLDAVAGSGFADKLTGDGNNNLLRGNGGNDTMDGGSGFDQVDYSRATGSVTVSLVTKTATGFDGSDTFSNIEGIRGGKAGDVLTGDAGDNYLRGNGGNDTIDGGAGWDTANYYLATGGVTVSLVSGTSSGADGNDTLVNIEGIDGSFVYDDSLTGNDSENDLWGFGGNDTLLGAGGGDFVAGGAGNDSMDGGSGYDVADYRDENAGVSVNLQTERATDGTGGQDTVVGFEEVRGTRFNDLIVGSSSNMYKEVFTGGLGNDTIDGGVVTDTLNTTNFNVVSYQAASGAVSVNLGSALGAPAQPAPAGSATGATGSAGTGGASTPSAPTGSTAGGFGVGQATGADGTDVLINIDVVVGSGYNDTLTGSARTDIRESFKGGAGDDTIDGGGGYFDFAEYTDATAGVTVVMTGGGNGTASGAGVGTDTLKSIEGILGSNFGDLITGSAYTGNALAGSELFRGNGGNDTIDGGGGNDWTFYDTSAAGVVVTLGDSVDGSASDGLGGTDVLRSIEGVRGSALNDTLTGSNRTDTVETFEGREGNDVIDGKGGLDTAWYKNSRSGVTVDLSQGKTLNDGYGGTDTLTNIENVYGSRDFEDSITGNSGANKLEGNGGNDTLDGGAGNDTLDGGANNTSNNSGDTVRFSGATSGVRVDLSSGTASDGQGGTDTLLNIENVQGTQYDDWMKGDDGVNWFIPGAGNDYVEGGLQNGRSDVVMYWDATAGVEINLQQGFARGTSIGNDTLVSIEAAHGSTFNDTITLTNDGSYTFAEAGDDLVYAGTKGAYINLGAGNDTVYGGAGGDEIRGDLGNDVLYGGGGNDAAVYDWVGGSTALGTAPTVITDLQISQVGSSWKVSNGDGGLLSLTAATSANGVTWTVTDLRIGAGLISMGTGTINGIESILLNGVDSDGASIGRSIFLTEVGAIPTASLQINGTEGDDSLYGSRRDDSIFGLGGNDYLSGGGGNDYLMGGDGNDTFAIGGNSSKIDGGAGFDTWLGDVGQNRIDGENLVGNASVGWSLVSGTGVVIGTIKPILGTGSWTLHGADETYFSVMSNIELMRITGVDAAGGPKTLSISIDNSLTAPSLTISNLGTQGNDSLMGTSGNDTIDGLGGDDTVNGLGGNDYLVGNVGHDALIGGAGNDTLNGSSDRDTAYYGDAPAGVVVNAVGYLGVMMGTSTDGQGGVDTLANIENIVGSAYADDLTANRFGAAVGGAGDDILRSGFGTAFLYGGAGNDTIIGSVDIDVAGFQLGTTRVDGLVVTGSAATGWTVSAQGSNILQISLNAATSAWSVQDLRPGSAGFGTDSLSNIEYLELQGAMASGSGSSVLKLTGGGSAGVSVASAMAADIYAIQGWQGQTVTGTMADDLIFGGDGNDTLNGGSGNDTLIGTYGNDKLVGGAGDDLLQGGFQKNLSWRFGRLAGWPDWDTADYTGTSTGGVKLDLSTMTTTGLSAAAIGNDTLRGIEEVDMTRQHDEVVGTLATLAGNNEFAGAQHELSIVGYGGSDSFSETLHTNTPWQDMDVEYWWSKTAINVTLTGSTGTVTYGAAGTPGGADYQAAGVDTLSRISEFTDTAYSDTFNFKEQTENAVKGQKWAWVGLSLGNDTVIGNGETIINFNGWASQSSTGKGIYVKLGAPGTASTVDLTHLSQNGVFGGIATLSDVNGVDGTQWDDTLVGSNANDRFDGRNGNDLLDGGAGWDTANYLWGSTTGISVNMKDGTVLSLAPTLIQRPSQTGTDALRSIEIVKGTNVDDIYDARGFSGTSTNAGSDGQWNKFQGNGGNDTIYGNGATSIAYDFSSVAVDVNLGTGQARALDTANQTGELAQVVGNDTFSGVYEVVGSALGDKLTGGGVGRTEGANSYEIFRPGAGNDTVDGKDGWDAVTYNDATSGITLDLSLATGQVQDGMGGTDTLVNIEGVFGSTFSDVLLGSDTNNNWAPAFISINASEALPGGMVSPAVYVTGVTGGNLDGLTNTANGDAFLAKYFADGSKGWTQLLGVGALNLSIASGTTHPKVGSVTTGPDGSIYVSGETTNSVVGLTNAGATDAFLIKYAPDGTKAWTQLLGSTAIDKVGGITTDASGSIFVTGQTYGSMDGNANAGDSDLFLTKYLSDGTKAWTKTLGSSKAEGGSSVTTGADGFVYVTGITTSATLEGKTSSGNIEVVLSKFATDGTKVWTQLLGTTDSDAGYAVKASADGSVFVAGASWSNLSGQTSNGSLDAFVAKYSPDGTRAWTRLLGSSGIDEAWAITTDSTGAAYVAGEANGVMDGQTFSGSSDGYLTKFGADGTKVWTRVLGTTAADIVTAVTVGADGGIYVTGETRGNLDGNTNSGASSAFLTRFAADGSKTWTKLLGTTAEDFAYGVAASPTTQATASSIQLTKAMTASDGSAYYLVSLDGSGMNHDVLDGIFNNGTDTTDALSSRTTMGDTINFTLMSSTELATLFKDPNWKGAPAGWSSVWSSTLGTSGNHLAVSVGSGVAASQSDTAVNYVIVRATPTGPQTETFAGGMGNDTIDGRAGYDAVYYGYGNPTAGVNVNLATGVAQDGFGTVDTLLNIEGVSGSELDDTLTGSAGDNRVEGRGGNDTLDGGAGIDWARYDNTTAGAVQVNLATGLATGGAGNDTLRNIENVLGSIFDDTLTGNAGANRLQGGAGNDTLSGGAGTDTAVYSGNKANYTVTRSGTGWTVQDKVGNEGTDTLTGIESLAFADQTMSIGNPPTGLVKISGIAKQNKTLTASNTLADLDGMGTVSYQWTANGVAINGSNTSTLLLTQAHVGKVIAVTASYTDGLGSAESASSANTVAVLNVNDLPTGAVNVDGTLQEGQTLMASNSLYDADGMGSVSYQWFSAETGAIAGANAISLTLGQAQVGQHIYAKASYTDGGGKLETKASTTSSAVANLNDAPTGSVLIDGNAWEGQTLTARAAISDSDGLGDFQYQWMADGLAIDDANGATLLLTTDLVGHSISVQMSYLDGGDTEETVESDPSADITPQNTAVIGDVQLLGAAKQYQVIHAQINLQDDDGLGSFKFQWYATDANGVKTAIAGATGEMLSLQQVQVGKRISMTTSYTDGHGNAESVDSGLSSAVLNVNDASTGLVSITGTAKQNMVLKATNKLADLDGLGTIAYQWKANGIAIASATTDTLTLTQAQVGSKISVTASYTDGFGASESKTSLSTVAVINVNDAPVISSATAVNFAENGSGAAYSVLASDIDTGTVLRYTVEGTDAALFNISATTGAVTFKSAPNFEAPVDAGTPSNNVYDITVKVSDGLLSATKAVAITVTNVNEAPTLTSGANVSFAENGTGTVYTATATDADAGTTLSYSIGGVDSARFNINTSTGAVTFKTVPNFEVPTDAGANNVYDVKVSATDGNFVTSKDVAISVTNVNEAPVLGSSTTVNYAENGKGVAYTAIATDVDAGTTLTYTIGGTDVSLFNINASTGGVTFKTYPNFEAPTDKGANNVYDITVTAKDASLNSNTQAVSIKVTDVLVEPGQSVIDLGSYGKLIAPVQVDNGNWYYFWDRSGNGVAGGAGGSLNGGVDTATHNVLDGLFNQDINGTVNTSVKNFDGTYGTTDTYRYATLNGVKLALPTMGITGATGAQAGTAVGAATAANGSNANNTKYNDLLAVWDAYNGTTTGSNLSGTPAKWQANSYWSATDVSSVGHATVNLSSGTLANFADTQTYFIALQVLG